MGESPMPDATAESQASSLAGSKGMLIYDGDCGFCTATARWIERRLSSGYLVIPSQRAELHSLGLTDGDVDRSAWWIDSDGVRSDEHHCIARALKAMSGPWPVLGRLLTLAPLSPLARCAYRQIARNRHHIRRPGGPKTCRL